MSDGVREKRRICRKTCDKPHYPYELPEGWEWCKLGDIAYVASGSTPEKSSFASEGIPYIKMYNLRNQKIDFDYKPQYIKEEVHNGKLQRSRTEIGDLIMNIVGPPLGKLALIPKSLPQANFNQAAILIRPYLHKDIINVYLKAYLEEMSEINSISTKGSAGQINISLTQSQNMRIPLPPLQEQIRINNELRVWLTSVQQIEDGRETLNLVMRQTKSKILDLAIHGKLVPQDPTDEPAGELLKRINPNAKITCDNPQYGKLPYGWCMTNIGSLFEAVSAKRVLKNEWKNKGIPFYRAREIVQLNKEGFADKDLFVSEEHYAELKEKYGVPICDDIMISAVGSIGYTYIVRKEDVFYYKDASVLCLKNTNHWNPTFFTIWLASPFLQEQMYKNSKGTTVDTITLEKLKGYAIPFPPINEQHRIVAKIEELFTQLDNITSSI